MTTATVSEKTQGLGTFSGVFMPNILQMVGVILYMRLGWITGHVGLTTMLVIITLSSLILTMTGLSMTSIVTNMKMKGGGSYYIISRSLGIELGTAIGLLLSLSQMTSIALCVSGFALSLQNWFPALPLMHVEVITICLLTLTAFISTNFVVKIQFFILMILAFSIVSVFMGSGANIPSSMTPLPTFESLSFWMAFAMFFPATTGIEAGMSMSGDLKNPSRSLPIGTLASILAAYVLYTSLARFLSLNVTKELLISYPMIACYVTTLSFVVVLGIWGATLSSALGGILGAPRTIQAIARDGMLPKFLGIGVGSDDIPRYAMLLTFILSTVLTVFTDINHLIPLLTMICLMNYGLINFVALFESIASNPSWRPSFKTPKIVSLLGSVGCLISMFMFNAGAIFIVLGLIAILTMWARGKRIQADWDDMRYSIYSFLAHLSANKLLHLEKTAKSWRPNILALVDPECKQQNLIYFSHAMNQSRGFLTFGTVIDPHTIEKSKFIKNYISKNKISGFYHINYAKTPFVGYKNLIENYGLGPIRPNTVVLATENLDLVSTCHRQRKNVILFKNADRKSAALFRKPFKKKQKKTISLWWRGEYTGNFELSLALAYLTQTSAIWNGAKLVINTLVDTEHQREKTLEKCEEYEKLLRLKDLTFKVYVEPNKNFFDAFGEFSKEADVTFLGLRKPMGTESEEEYINYLNTTLTQTENVANIAYILTGEEINFQELFE